MNNYRSSWPQQRVANGPHEGQSPRNGTRSNDEAHPALW